MSTRTTLLLERLDAIGASLAASGRGLALIGLGSVGDDLHRMDDFSDLDFFAIVQPGSQQAFVADLGWMESVHPVAYAFRNTADGYKLLYADGVFCEFAVFEPEALSNVPLVGGRVVWQAPGSPDVLHIPHKAAPQRDVPPVDWLIGEALTNLYVGLGRYRRGETLTAMRFVQVYAVDRIVDLAGMLQPAGQSTADVFDSHRRIELRHPWLAEELPQFTQGYTRTVESARAILRWLEAHYPVNPAMRQAILDLCL